MKFNYLDGGEDEINMAPMIDMVFLLLIFFMVASHMTSIERVQLELPVAECAKVQENTPSRQLISIRALNPEGTEVEIFMNLGVVSPEEVGPMLKRQLEDDAELEVSVRADRRVRHRHVREVMAACAEAGVGNVIFSTFESGR